LVKKSISVYLDDDIIRALGERAEEQGISVSALCRIIITRDVRGQPQPKPEPAKACPNCGKTVGEKDEDGQQIFYLFPNGTWRCTNCGSEGMLHQVDTTRP